ncbi:ABC transporter permease [Paraburkholderia unamae]|uniref:Peptide/nickel transport system permease protein n=1 Tax=Paraburkholderia unamae TaxID=219649 RepID=A0ABX5KC41_9BURK|nr:ABC transporter permease [Paraburkholderia unamae]PVX70751.1 peptide/nickel transport system permease protein [Paraburkholderia unamae]RAR50707.1 peptide/nickel transport system permease protein [Paraburkholderia unamae]CAG9251521.1 Peptide/nickel transport system permease protein [Paraburkholderia unamae]
MNRPATSHATTVLYATSESEERPAAEAAKEAPNDIPTPPRSPLRRLAGRLSVLGLIGLAIVVFWLGVAFIGPLVAPYKGGAITSTEIFGSYSAAHLLGTDFLGRDMLSRVLYGTQYTVGLALAATLLASGIGIFFGLLAAVAPRWIDEVLSRIFDALISIPSKVLALVVIAAFGSSVPMLITVAALAYIPGAFRISRSLAVNLMTLEYVQVARARGEGLFYIARVEVLPNMIHPMLADFGLRFVFIVLLLSGLSFLGLGVQPPDADWGSLVRENIGGLAEGAPAVLMPAVAIATLTVGVNLLIDSLRRHGGRAHGGGK